MTREDLEDGGPDIRLSVLAKLVGFSKHKLYADARRGVLGYVLKPCGSKYYVYVPRPAALAYLETMQYRWPLASRKGKCDDGSVLDLPERYAIMGKPVRRGGRVCDEGWHGRVSVWIDRDNLRLVLGLNPWAYMTR